MTTRSMPDAFRQASTQSTILARSVIWRLVALAITRRISRADTGLAMMPTVGAKRGPPPARDPEKWAPVFRSDHAPPNKHDDSQGAFSQALRLCAALLWDLGRKAGTP